MIEFKIFIYWCSIYCYILQTSVAKDTNDYNSYSNDSIPVESSGSQHKCANGIYIPIRWVCDDTKDCEDGSDEDLDACRNKHPTYCSLSKYTSNITIVNCQDDVNVLKGLLVKEFTLISVPPEVGNGFSDEQFICIDGKWITTSENEEKGCEIIPTTNYFVEALYYDNGRQVISNVTESHFRGTVIYPICREGAYPNVKEATCGGNGKWSVDHFECLSCKNFEDIEMLSFSIVEFASLPKTVSNCRAHIISPYLIATDASCLLDSPATNLYYLDISIQDIARSRSRSPPNLVEIKEIYYYKNSRDKNFNYRALAEMKHRFTFSTNFSSICMDWKQEFGDNQINLIRNGAGFPSFLGYYRINETVTNTSTELDDGFVKYLDWIKSIISLTDQDHKIPDTSISRIPNVFIKNGSISIENIKINCTNGIMYREFVDGCVLPGKKDHNINYEIVYWQKKFQKKFHDFHKNAIDFDNVCEYTYLQNVRCENGSSNHLQETVSSSCFRGTWHPPIPKCDLESFFEIKEDLHYKPVSKTSNSNSRIDPVFQYKWIIILFPMCMRMMS